MEILADYWNRQNTYVCIKIANLKASKTGLGLRTRMIQIQLLSFKALSYEWFSIHEIYGWRSDKLTNYLC